MAPCVLRHKCHAARPFTGTHWEVDTSRTQGTRVWILGDELCFVCTLVGAHETKCGLPMGAEMAQSPGRDCAVM